MSTGSATARLLVASLAGVLLLGVSGCSAGGRDRPSVVVTTNILGDITRNIVGDEAEVTVLMQAGADPALLRCLGSAGGVHRAGRSGRPQRSRPGGERPAPCGGRRRGRRLHPGGRGMPSTRSPTPRASRPKRRTRTSGPIPSGSTEAVGLIADQVTEHVGGVDSAVVARNATAYAAQVAGLTAWMREQFARHPAPASPVGDQPPCLRISGPAFRLPGRGGGDPERDHPRFAERLRPQVPCHGDRDDGREGHLRGLVATGPAGPGAETRERHRGAVVPLFSESLTAKGKGAATYLEMMRANTKAIADGPGSRHDHLSSIHGRQP